MIHVLPDAEALSAAAAEWVADQLADTARTRGRASIVLSGGATPKTMYERLAARFEDRIPWPRLHVFWTDERYVPHDHALSNYRMAKEALLDRVRVPPAQVYPMSTHFSEPADAARDYETAVARYFGGTPPVFDVMLLGIGADGHTASVFAGSPALTSASVVLAVTAPAEPASRLTLTLPVIASARHIGVLVAGASKAGALAAALGGGPSELPAAMLARSAPSTVWWIDRGARAGVGPSVVEDVEAGGPR